MVIPKIQNVFLVMLFCSVFIILEGKNQKKKNIELFLFLGFLPPPPLLTKKERIQIL